MHCYSGHWTICADLNWRSRLKDIIACIIPELAWNILGHSKTMHNYSIATEIYCLIHVLSIYVFMKSYSNVISQC